MTELSMAKLVYTTVLLLLVWLLLLEVRRVWFDDTLYVQPFRSPASYSPRK
jgi:hypothetical protein